MTSNVCKLIKQGACDVALECLHAMHARLMWSLHVYKSLNVHEDIEQGECDVAFECAYVKVRIQGHLRSTCFEKLQSHALQVRTK